MEAQPIIKAARRKRKKAAPLEVELDLRGKVPIRNMPKSGLEGEKEARTISVGNFRQQEDLKMYGKVPDYGESHGYDLGIDSELSQIAKKIYANFHKPSWPTLKRHLFMAEIPKKLFRHRKF